MLYGKSMSSGFLLVLEAFVITIPIGTVPETKCRPPTDVVNPMHGVQYVFGDAWVGSLSKIYFLPTVEHEGADGTDKMSNIRFYIFAPEEELRVPLKHVNIFGRRKAQQSLADIGCRLESGTKDYYPA